MPIEETEELDDIFEDEPETEDDTELQKVLGDYLDDSIGTGADDEIMQQREQALKIYYREPYGDEIEGRSKFITSEAMDTVNWLLPSLLNVFLSQPKIVEFVPSQMDAVAEADQMTDYINYLVVEENPNAFLTFYTWFWDALVTKTGFVKYYYKDVETREEETYTGVTEEQLNVLWQSPDITIKSVRKDGGYEEQITPNAVNLGIGGEQQNIIDPQMAQDMQVPMAQPSPAVPQAVWVDTYAVTVDRVVKDKQLRIDNIAPSNVFVHSKATSMDDVKFIGIIYYKTKSDLLEDGFAMEQIDELPTTTNTEANSEDEVRNQVNLMQDNQSAIDYYEIYECYVKIPNEITGLDELHRVIFCDRNARIILEDIRVDEIPIAPITPFPKPYSFFGTSIVDMVKDLQRCNTAMWRTMLDYMYTSAYPQWEIIDRNIVNKDDVQRRIPGGLIRTRQLGSIQPIQVPQFPTEVASLLDRLRYVKDSRTGVTAFNSGLDPNALKAETSTAGLEMATAGKQIQDMIARTFAETGIKQLFKGIYGLVVKNANEKKVIRLRGSYVEIDPTTWKLPVRVSANVGLGTGTAKAKANDLQQLLGLQLQFMPYRVATEKNLYNTLSELVNTMGYKNVDTFLTDPALIPPPPVKPTAEEVAIEKIKMDYQAEQLKADVDKYQTDVNAEVKLTQLQVDTALKQEALALKYAEGKDPDSRTDYFPGVKD